MTALALCNVACDTRHASKRTTPQRRLTLGVMATTCSKELVA